MKLLELFYAANAERGDRRWQLLTQADHALNMLKIFIRLAYDVKTINQERYISLQSSLQEIGRMLGGWIKTTNGNKKENPTI